MSQPNGDCIIGQQAEDQYIHCVSNTASTNASQLTTIVLICPCCGHRTTAAAFQLGPGMDEQSLVGRGLPGYGLSTQIGKTNKTYLKIKIKRIGEKRHTSKNTNFKSNILSKKKILFYYFCFQSAICWLKRHESATPPKMTSWILCWNTSAVNTNWTSNVHGVKTSFSLTLRHPPLNVHAAPNFFCIFEMYLEKKNKLCHEH